MHIKWVLLALFCFSSPLVSQADESKSELENELGLDDLSENETTEEKQSETKTEDSNSENNKSADSNQVKKTSNKPAKKSKTISRDTTKVDFDAAAIEGERKVPQNMFLNGQIKQDFNQLIHLRRNFRNELRNSGAAVRALVK